MRNHGSFIRITVIICLAILAIPAIAMADSIVLKSNLVNEWNVRNGNTGPNVKITAPYPLSGTDDGWEQNGSDYFWVSYADTGYPDECYQGIDNPLWPSNVRGTITLPNPEPPTAVFYESFSLPYDINTGSVTIWADDTARVYLGKKDNIGDYIWTLLMDANPIQGTYCADGPIGCTPSNGQTFNFNNLHLASGDYELQLDAYQRNEGPFGVLYTGSIDSEPIPEPSSLLLLASSAAVICFLSRRRTAEQTSAG